MKETENALQKCREIAGLYSGSAEEMIVLSDPAFPQQKEYLPTVYFPIYNQKMVVEDDPQSVFQLPETLCEHYEELMHYHRNSSVYNNVNIRINGWAVKGDAFVIQTGRCTYFDTLLTNRSMDFEFGNGLTVRRLFEPGPEISPLETSRLSNHLGINGFIESSDHSFCFVYRKKSVSVGKQLWACGVSGSLKAKYSIVNGTVTADSLISGIVAEVLDELNLPSVSVLHAGEDRHIVPVFAYRDLVEGGKPHLFFYAGCRLSKEEITRYFHKKASGKNDSTGDLTIEMSSDGNQLLWVSRSDLENPERFRLYPDRFLIGEKTFFTNPSYAACIEMLRIFLMDQGTERLR